MKQAVALVFGGSEEVFAEYEAALEMCRQFLQPTKVLVCNSALEDFDGEVDYGITLHPEKLATWLVKRTAKDFPAPKEIWAHGPATNVHRHTRDWGGSSSLLATKVARQIGFPKVILCGCPMTVENGHFQRHKKWDSALAFRPRWISYRNRLPARCVRSMSGWTKEQFGAPDQHWLESTIDVPPLQITPT